MQSHLRPRVLNRLLGLLLGLSFPVSSLPARAVEPDIRYDTTVAAIQKVTPSVVNIATSRVVEYGDFYDPIFNKFYGSTWKREELNSIGSGVIISKDGYVLTNVHVLRRASRAQVKLWDGRVYDAEPVVLVNPRSDVAVLKLKCKPGETFQPIQFAADDDLVLGETVLALGDPYGLGDSVSRGILSSKSRQPASSDAPLGVQNWLQTDADINPGNSGGPLVDLRGQMIGINVAVYREEQGMGVGFAIPVKEVSATLSQLFTPEVTSGLWFGAQIKGGQYPLAIATVQTNSPADKAGLRVGQQILQVNGQAPKSLVEFNQFIAGASARPVALTVQQGAERLDLNATLVPFEQMVRAKTGLTLRAPTNNADAPIGWLGGKGMVIDRIEPGSPAAQAKLQPGCLLTGIDGTAADQLLTVGEVLAGKQPGDPARFTVVVKQRINDNFVNYQQGTVDLKVR